MASPQNDNLNSQSLPKYFKKETDIYEDEINLIDYFIVLWKRKWFIFLASVLPSLVVGLAMFLWPRDYKVTYIYDISLNEKGYKVLLDEFYSSENLDKIMVKLKENRLDKYGQRIAKADKVKDLKKLVSFEVSPSYFEPSNTSKIADVKNLQEIQQITGTLLTMAIVGKPKNDMERISLIVRDNFEKVVPTYSVKHGLNSNIISLKTKMADIEENRFGLELELETKKAILAKLRGLKPEDSNKIASDIILQFNNVDANSTYLPLAYQIRAAESIIINLEGTFRGNEEKYKYYSGLLNLNERLSDELKKKVSSCYTIQEFYSFLTNIAGDYKDKKLTGYLNAYIKRIENSISRNTPVMEKPRVYPVTKGTAKKIVIMFAVLLMITTLAAFVLEAVSKKQFRPS